MRAGVLALEHAVSCNGTLTPIERRRPCRGEVVSYSKVGSPVLISFSALHQLISRLSSHILPSLHLLSSGSKVPPIRLRQLKLSSRGPFWVLRFTSFGALVLITSPCTTISENAHSHYGNTMVKRHFASTWTVSTAAVRHLTSGVSSRPSAIWHLKDGYG